MSDTTTKQMLRPFLQSAPAPMFLSSFFKSPPENFHTSESVEIDVQRDGEDVAIAIVGGLNGGARHNENSLGTNKEMVPPVFKERATISAAKLISREFGEHPFQSLAFQAKAILRTAIVSGKIERKIRRSIELQASQVLQTGTVTLLDEGGIAVYTIDYSGKASHFDVVPVTWHVDGTAGDPLGDLEGMADRIRSDGLTDPDVLVCGKGALARLLANPKVEKRVTRDGLALGGLSPAKRDSGATFYGLLWIGSYQFQIWTYSGGYIHPQTKIREPFVADDKIIMLSSGARLDLSYGAIPRFAPPDQQIMQFLPRRVSDSAAGVDMHISGWLERDGESLTVQIGARPLCIPTEIDSFGCLDVVV